MYDFIFYVIYIQQYERGRGGIFSRYSASFVTMFAITVHCTFLFLGFKNIFSDWYRIHVDKLSNIWNVVFVIATMIIVYAYYNSHKIEKITRKHSNDHFPDKPSNYFKIFLIIFIPLIANLFLEGK